MESQGLVFAAAGERGELVGRPERAGGGAFVRNPLLALEGAGSPRGWSMTPLVVPVAAAGCGKLLGCRLIGGSAMR
jgi:hypothetical protein